jgi:eukaryotic-like serine/threonine-protein kinase
MSNPSAEQSRSSVDLERPSYGDFSILRARKRALLDEQRSCWSQGRPLEPEELMDRWPTNPDTDPDAASVLLEDYLARRRRDEAVSALEYERRFPEQQQALDRLLTREHALRSMGGDSDRRVFSLCLPAVGDEIFGFRLCLALGQGAFGRVYLAEQGELAGRPVVLKVTAIEGEEPQTLAQLLHTNIVPIYSLHEDQRAGLRAFCMPYLGGASLSAVLTKVWTDSSRPVSGRQLVLALESVAAPRPSDYKSRRNGVLAANSSNESTPSGESVREAVMTPAAALLELSYERAAASIVAQLADGLHHAHQRGILHRDIKPSNILISAEGQSLLLDFNLSPAGDAAAAHAVIGGTVAYMAPEHLRALVGRTPALIRQVDRRSDIYSLGMVLAEIITGRRPFEQSGSYSALPLQIEAMAVERTRCVPSLRRERPDISWGLESIARKCLAPEPGQRYQQADHLAEDLRCLLSDRRLKHAPELCRMEQARKFVRRHPRLSSSGSVAGIAAIVLLGVGSALAGLRGQLADTRARETVSAHDTGMLRALCLVNTHLDMQDNLRDGIAACEQTLALFGAPEDAEWDRRPMWLRISAQERWRLAEDRRELLLLLADARVRLAGGSSESAAHALSLLENAESIPGLRPSRALWLDRARYCSLRSQPEQADSARRRALETPATTARDHYLLATSLARQGGPEGQKAAIAELNEALAQNPRHYWSLVQRGICRFERAELVEAAADFGQCTGIWPEFAWGYFNRGCVLDRTGNKAAAVLDFSAALARDPTLVPALVNRGLARLELKEHALALADFDRAQALGSRDASVVAGRGVALERLGRHREADAAFTQCFALARSLPAAARARLFWAYGFAVSAREPDKAQSAFDRALSLDPGNSQALYGRAMLAMSRGKNVEAIRGFDQALEANPGRIEARRYRAIALARQGEWARASQEINRCLEREPRSAATLYSAACVVALACEKTNDSANSRQALDLLDRALAEGADPANAAVDPDLAAIRRLPRFERLISEARSSGRAPSSGPG